MVNNHDEPSHTEPGDRVAALLHHAGRPIPVEEQHLQSLREVLRTEWRSTRSADRTGSWWHTTPWVPAAAVVLLGATVGLWSAVRDEPRLPATSPLTVEAIHGLVAVTKSAEGSAVEPLFVGQVVPIGSELQTLAGFGEPTTLALRSASGHSLRLDSGSRVTIVSEDRFELHSGAVYVDSGSTSSPSQRVAIATPLGTVREVGTQFEVRLVSSDSASGNEPAVRVRVREGAVSLTQGVAVDRVESGGELLRTERGALHRGDIAPFDSSWQWVVEAGPGFAIEGRNVAEMLDWAAREAGWELRYVDDEVAATARQVVYRGVFVSLRPEEAVEIALPAALLEGNVRDGVLQVRRAGDG